MPPRCKVQQTSPNVLTKIIGSECAHRHAYGYFPKWGGKGSEGREVERELVLMLSLWEASEVHQTRMTTSGTAQHSNSTCGTK